MELGYSALNSQYENGEYVSFISSCATNQNVASNGIKMIG